MAPLPRACQWADGSTYVSHVELVHKARGVEIFPEFWIDPLMYQGGSDDLADAHGPIICRSKAFGIDFGTKVAVVTDDAPMGTEPATAAEGICLIVLVNDVSLRNLIPTELVKGSGFFQSKPATALLPVAVTPGELGDAWRECRVHPPMTVHWSNKKVGQPEYDTDIMFDFGRLIAHICKTRNVCADSIVRSGTISNVDHNEGCACIAEKRMLETIESGAPATEFMRYGDTVKIEMFDTNDVSIFGTIG